VSHSIGRALIKPDNVNPDELNPDEINPDELNPDKLNPDKINPDKLIRKLRSTSPTGLFPLIGCYFFHY
jgi:hypothetical protein